MANLRDVLSKRSNAYELRNQLGYKRELGPDNVVRVTVPTLPFEAFDSTGEKVLPWHILKLTDSAQLRSYFPMDDDSAPNQAISYLVYCGLEVDSSFYSHKVPKYPLVIEGSYRYAKRSSMASAYTIRHTSRAQPYVKVEHVGVNVDPVTRKPIPFPDGWKNKYGIPSDVRRTEHVVPSKDEWTVTMVTEHKVSFSDVDENGHANYTFYGRISYDSFAEHLFSNRLNNGASKYFNNGLKVLQLTFLKESLMGDLLNVESWRDRNLDNTYYFEIKKNGELCARTTIVFHRESADALVHKL